MSQGLDMTVNSLPSRTWNWLKMNESKLKEIEAGDTWDVKRSSRRVRRNSWSDKGAQLKIRKFFSHIHTEWVRIWTV